MAVLTTQFLSGEMQLPISIPLQWQALFQYVVPNSTGVLLQQLQSVQTRLNALLAATPDPKLAPGTIVIPITVVIDYQNALNTYEYQFNGFPNNLYADTRAELDSVYDQYNITFQTTGDRSKPFWYGG